MSPWEEALEADCTLIYRPIEKAEVGRGAYSCMRQLRTGRADRD